jgi:tRNA 2-thiouridine synthesizing protein A
MPAADHKLNALGLLCPLPLLFAVREMTTLDPGQVLQIIGDDPGLYADVPAWCEKAGHHLLGFEEEEGVIMCWIEKGNTPGSGAEADDLPDGATPGGESA